MVYGHKNDFSLFCVCSAGVDYDGSSMVVTVEASSGPGETCFDIDIFDDSVFESDEEFLVSVQTLPGSGARIGSVDSTCVRIIDDDEGTYI